MTSSNLSACTLMKRVLGHWNRSLFKQGTSLEATAHGNLEMIVPSAHELAEFIPSFSIFSAGCVHGDGDFMTDSITNVMGGLKHQVEDDLGSKRLGVMYFGRHHVNQRTDQEMKTLTDLAGVKLGTPGSWSCHHHPSPGFSLADVGGIGDINSQSL